MIEFNKLKIIGYMKNNQRWILIQYEDVSEIIEFEKYQSEGILNQIDSSLKEFYKFGDKKILENLPRNINILINTFYKMSLPSGFGLSYSYFR